jgi:hypothetical protein
MYKDEGYETFTRTGDIYSLFYERGLQLTKKDTGLLCYITSNKWMRTGYGEKTRGFLANHNPLKIIDLGGEVFDSATVDTNILLIENTENLNITLALNVSKEKNITSFDGYNNKWVTIKDLTSDTWTISSEIEQSIKSKIESVGTPLKEWDINIYRGILTGYNDAFIIDSEKKYELIAQDPKSSEIIKPILRGRDIKNYKTNFADLWLINTHNGIRGKIPRIDVEKDYPAVYNHLLMYEEILKKRQDKGDHWSNLRNCAYIEEFEKEKIAFPVVNRKWSFIFVEKGVQILAPMRFITSDSKESLLYIKSVFGGRLIKWWWKNFGNMQDDNGYQMDNYIVEQVPIPLDNSKESSLITEITFNIIANKEKGVDTSELESQIDQLVYQLYNLTPEEITLVEESIKKE